jgi:hypothetical protein
MWQTELTTAFFAAYESLGPVYKFNKINDHKRINPFMTVGFIRGH